MSSVSATDINLLDRVVSPLATISGVSDPHPRKKGLVEIAREDFPREDFARKEFPRK
jgi:hypothetical protein